MPEKDHLDQMLDSALSSYGETESNSALAERILARVVNEQRPHQLTPRRRGRFVLWAALPAAACLLLTLLVLKSSGPPVTSPSGGSPQTASTNTDGKAPGVENVTTLAPKTIVRTRHQASADVAESAVRPKQDVFPLPQPLSPEEQALIAIATAPVASARENLIASQRQLDAPLQISAIDIPALTKPDEDAK